MIATFSFLHPCGPKASGLKHVGVCQDHEAWCWIVGTSVGGNGWEGEVMSEESISPVITGAGESNGALWGRLSMEDSEDELLTGDLNGTLGGRHAIS